MAFHKAVIALRRSHPALCAGDYTSLYADPDVYVFARTLSDNTVITAVNVAEAPRRCKIPLANRLNMQLASAEMLFTTGGSPSIELAAGSLGLALPARSGVVFDTLPETYSETFHDLCSEDRASSMETFRKRADLGL